MPRSPSPYAHGRSEIWGRSAIEKALAREQRRLGDRVRALRENGHMTQEQAAEKIGIHPKHLSRIEGGAVNLTFGTLVALAIAYEVSLAKLFEEPTRGKKRTTSR